MVLEFFRHEGEQQQEYVMLGPSLILTVIITAGGVALTQKALKDAEALKNTGYELVKTGYQHSSEEEFWHWYDKFNEGFYRNTPFERIVLERLRNQR